MRRQKGNTVFGGIAGPVCSWGKIYEKLDMQVGRVSKLRQGNIIMKSAGIKHNKDCAGEAQITEPSSCERECTIINPPNCLNIISIFVKAEYVAGPRSWPDTRRD
jgi:hypothetical protein